MNKLNIGDKVRVLDNSLAQDDIKIGSMGRIYDFGSTDESYKVVFDDERLPKYTFIERQLELYERKPEPIILKNILSFLGTEYIKVVNENQDVVYYGGKVEDLSYNTLKERALNIWTYGIVKSIKPSLMSFEGTRVLGLKIIISVYSV